MKFIKTKVNPHYLSHLGSMNQSKRIPGPGVSLLTVPASPDLHASSFCSRVGSQQIYCFRNLEIHVWKPSLRESISFMYVCVLLFCVCIFVCACVYLCVYVCDMCTCGCLYLHVLCICVCVCVCASDTLIFENFIRKTLPGLVKVLKISSILLW